MKPLSTITVDVEVDTDDLDIAIGKAKELNRELGRAKALMDSMTCKGVGVTITLKPFDDVKSIAECVMEQLKRDIKTSY